MMKWIIDRLSEPSTWKGLIAVATGAGLVSFSPELATAVVAAGASAFGLVDVIRNERKNEDSQ